MTPGGKYYLLFKNEGTKVSELSTLPKVIQLMRAKAKGQTQEDKPKVLAPTVLLHLLYYLIKEYLLLLQWALIKNIMVGCLAQP